MNFESIDRNITTKPDWYRDERGCLKPLIFEWSDVFGVDRDYGEGYPDD
jgi:hypothetical protein